MIRTLKHILLVFLTIFLFFPSCGNVREYIEQERRPESPSIGNPNFLEFVEGFEGTSEYRLLEISALATVTMAGNERYLYAGARSDNAILVFNISDAQLEHIQTIMDVDSPAYHLEEVNELITFQVNEQHYVATSSFKESGFNIFKVGIDGKLTIIDSREDTRDINLTYTSYLHVVTHGTDTFLIVGSGVLEHSVLEGKGLSIYKFENDEVTLESTVPLNSNELLPLIADIRSIQTPSGPVIFVGSMDRQDNSLLTSYRMDSSGAVTTMTHISSIRHDDVISEGSVETDDFGYGRSNRYGFYAISALEIFSANENAPVFLLVAGDRIGSVSLFEVSRTDGSLRHIVSILWDFDNGRQEFVSGIFNLLHIYYADTSYLLFPNNTYSMGIYRASASGLDYVNVMYAMPGLHLRNVRAIASVHIDGRYYVFTAGSDRGIGMFKMNGEDDGATLIPIFDPICTNGTPSTVKISTDNTEKCVSCDNYYALKRDESCTPVIVETLAGTGTAGFMDGAGNVAQFYEPTGVAVDSVGNVYVAVKNSHRIRKITSGGVVTTLAGTGTAGFMDGAGNVAQFNEPRGVAVDGLGNIYVADTDNNRIRKITPGGVVSTFAGTGTAGNMDGAGNVAQFNNPYGVAVDGLGNIYVADTGNHHIRKITSGGVVSTLVGTASPAGVVVDVSGNVYVTDSNNHRIRKITFDSSGTGTVTTLAGTVTAGFMDGAGNVAQFNEPRGVALDSVGNVYVADTNNNRIRKITPSGVVSTLAGTGTQGDMDGVGNIAQFNEPRGVAVDSVGNVYVTDTDNHRIRRLIIESPTIDPICTNGTPSTAKVFFANTEKCVSCDSGFDLNGEICGGFDPICTNGTPSTTKVFTANTEKCASCNNGFGLDGELCREQFDPICTNGVASMVKLFTANTGKCASCNNYYALKRDETCTPIMVETLAGTGTAGFMDGAGNVAQFNVPVGIAVDGLGNVYVGGRGNGRIRKITSGGVVSTFAGTGTQGFMDGVANVAQFNIPRGVALDASGNLYVGDLNNNRIRKITSGGVVSTFAGTGTAGFMDGAGNVAQFNGPHGVVVDGSEFVYVADGVNDRIRKITPGGVVSTLAGTGTRGFMDGAGNVAQFNNPRGVAVDSSGNVYVADRGNSRIRKITPGGVVSTFAGTGTAGFMDGAGNVAQFHYPIGIALDSIGNIYVADNGNNRIRKITPGGMVSTLAGTGIKADGTAGGGFMDGAGNVAQFHAPGGVAVDSVGNVYVADRSNHRIRRLIIESPIIDPICTNGTPSTAKVFFANTEKCVSCNSFYTLKRDKTCAPVSVSTLAGTGSYGFMDGAVYVAKFSSPIGVAVDSSGFVYVGDNDNHRIRKITSGGVVSTLAGTGTQGFMDGAGNVAQFNFPAGVVVDGSGNVYVADTDNNRIRKITSGGVVSTLAGTGTAGDMNGAGTVAEFRQPREVAVDGSDNVYVTDAGNHRICKISTNFMGVIVVSTLAGTGIAGSMDGAGNVAQFNGPRGVAVDDSGFVYVTDSSNDRIRKITSGGMVSMLAGTGTTGSMDGAGNVAQFNYPNGVAVDNSGNVYVADNGNNRIRKITSTGVVSTLAGTGRRGFRNGAGNVAKFDGPVGVAVDSDGNVYVADQHNNRIRKITIPQ